MTQNLPAETLKISPEALEVANCYLQLQDTKQVADALDLTPDQVQQYLQRKEVRGYIDHVFQDMGYNNRFLMRKAMDAIIKQKFRELEESGVGSNKDIADLLQISHKMSMDLLDKEIQLAKLQQAPSGPQRQVNVQINDTDTSKYAQLVQKLMTGTGV